MKTTPGSSASPAMSPSRYGSATTTPGASRRWAAARPAATSPFRSSSRSSRRPGIFTGRKRRCRRPRRKPRAVSRRCRSITPAAKSSPPTARTGSPSISSSTPTRSCGTLNIRWPGAAAWRAASRGPAWQAVSGPGPAPNVIEERRQYAPPSAGGRLPPSNRVPRNLRELFGFVSRHAHKSATVLWEFCLKHAKRELG